MAEQVPAWATRRVRGAVDAATRRGERPDVPLLARRAGLSRGLVVRALRQLETEAAAPGPR